MQSIRRGDCQGACQLTDAQCSELGLHPNCFGGCLLIKKHEIHKIYRLQLSRPMTIAENSLKWVLVEQQQNSGAHLANPAESLSRVR